MCDSVYVCHCVCFRCLPPGNDEAAMAMATRKMKAKRSKRKSTQSARESVIRKQKLTANRPTTHTLTHTHTHCHTYTYSYTAAVFKRTAREKEKAKRTEIF